MRILLVLAGDNTYTYGKLRHNRAFYAPLTLTALAGLVPRELDPEITLVDEGVQQLPPEDSAFDVVGISCAVSAAPRAYALARSYRARGAFVVLGGPHPTALPEEAAEHADAVVAGPAERAWPALLRQVASGDRPRGILREPARAMEGRVALPRRDLLPSRRYLTTGTVQASRGCGNRCAFCSICSAWEHQAVTRPVGDVVDEIRAMRRASIVFLDPNLLGDRAYAKELLTALAPLRVRWRGPATIDIADDPELLQLAVRSGCTGLLFGLETNNDANLKDVGKGFNQASRYREIISTLHECRIQVLGCFVLGFDHDTLESLNALPDFIDEIGVDVTRLALLTPFPGTKLFDRLDSEGRILTRDWRLYDTEHVVFQPGNLVPEDLLRCYHQTWDEVYRLTRVGRRAWRRSLGSGPLEGIANLVVNTAFKIHFPTSKYNGSTTSSPRARD